MTDCDEQAFNFETLRRFTEVVDPRPESVSLLDGKVVVKWGELHQGEATLFDIGDYVENQAAELVELVAKQLLPMHEVKLQFASIDDVAKDMEVEL
jgi:hypothetical protein